MGHKEEAKPRDMPHVQIQERGEIFFFYRPKINKEDPSSIDDVQRMYLVLRPESGQNNIEVKQSPDSGKEGKFAAQDEEEKGNVQNTGASYDSSRYGGKGSEKVNIDQKPLLRFIVMGRKSLPEASKRTRPYWGFVDLVTTNVNDVKKALASDDYDTSTRGTRHKPSCRPVGEGVYVILRHKTERQTHSHLIYRLKFPASNQNHEPQNALKIGQEGSFIIQIKNPEKPAPPFVGLQSKRKTTFPAKLQGQFGSYRFVAADPPDFLNFEGCEFILISASDDIEEELGLDLKLADESCSDLLDLFNEKGSKYELHVKPLLEGHWE